METNNKISAFFGEGGEAEKQLEATIAKFQTVFLT